jgi:DNA-binding beta-propeller fold protein YncE
LGRTSEGREGFESLVNPVPVGTFPVLSLYDPIDQALFLTSNATHFPGSNELALTTDFVQVINVTQDRLAATLYVGNETVQLAFDPADDTIIAANFESGSLSFISGHTDTIEGNVTLPGSPLGVVYDPENGQIYVSMLGGVGHNYTGIEELSAQGRSEHGFIHLNFAPGSLLYLQTQDSIAMGPGLVPGAGVDQSAVFSNLSVMNISDSSVRVLNVTTEAFPLSQDGMVEVSPDGIVAVPGFTGGYEAANSSIIFQTPGDVVLESTTLNRVEGQLKVGLFPQGLALDPLTGELYIPNSFSDNMSVYNLTNDQLLGTFALGPPPPAGWGPTGIVWDGSTGEFYISETEPSTQVVEALSPGIVTFFESGLPSGGNWTVTLGGESESSTSSTIAFDVPNGTYAYTIRTPLTNVTAGSSTGSVRVHGYAVRVDVSFGPALPELLGLPFWDGVGAIVTMLAVGTAFTAWGLHRRRVRRRKEGRGGLEEEFL